MTNRGQQAWSSVISYCHVRAQFASSEFSILGCNRTMGILRALRLHRFVHVPSKFLQSLHRIIENKYLTANPFLGSREQSEPPCMPSFALLWPVAAPLTLCGSPNVLALIDWYISGFSEIVQQTYIPDAYQSRIFESPSVKFARSLPSVQV
jgi:hypothetical protein